MKNVLYKGIFGCLAITLLTSLPARAQLTVWTGANSSDWFDDGNWTMNQPNAAVNAQVDQAPIASIAGGGAASARSLSIGTASADNGEVDVHDTSTLTLGVGPFTIGNAGTGTLLLLNHSVTTANQNNVIIGSQTDSTGTVAVQDNAVLDVTGQQLRVGDSGTGTLTISDKASVTAGHMDVGTFTGSTGLVDVSTTYNTMIYPVQLFVTGNANVGTSGTGTMDIHGGGAVAVNGTLEIGLNTDGVGTVLVRGGESGLFVTQNIDVGAGGNGTMEIHNGGSVTGDRFRVARDVGSTGLAIVEGTGSMGNASTLTVNTASVGGFEGGPGGVGELQILNGGDVEVATDMVVWGSGAAGADRSTLVVDSTYVLAVGGTLTFDGGRLLLRDGTDFINDVNLDNFPGPDLNGMFAEVTDSNTATISGELSGNGQLVKIGNGTLVLTNLNNSYSGGTDINNGTLVVGTPSTNPFESVFGVGDVNLNNGTLRTPEGTPFSYEIGIFLGPTANFNANGGTLLTQVGGTNSGVDSDEMFVYGNANLGANSGLFVHRVNGYNPNNGDVVMIIDTFLGVNGQFGNAPQGAVAPNDFLGLIQPFADYSDPFEVNLIFGFANTFTSVAKTPNQIATAQALDAAVAAGCIIPATNLIGNLPINILRHTYDLIAPEELASMYEASFAQGMVQSLNLQRRMDDIRWGSTGFCADGFVIQDNHGYTKNDGKSVADKNVVEQTAPPNYRWGTFITGSGELTKTGEEDDNANGYQLNQAGFTLGVDYRVTDHWAIGLSGGYSHTTAQLVDNGRLNTDGGKMGLYTTYYTGGFYVDAAASGGWNQYDTRRSALIGQENGSTDGAEFNGMIGAGFDWKRGCWTFGPTASFEYNYVEFNSFTESATSVVPLHFPDQNQSAYRTNLGFRVAHEQVMKPGEGLTVVPELRASWRHDFGSSAYAIDSNFVGCDDVFTVHGPWIGRDSAVVDLGLTAYCTPGLSAYVFYDGQFGRDNYNNNAISGGFRVAF